MLNGDLRHPLKRELDMILHYPLIDEHGKATHHKLHNPIIDMHNEIIIEMPKVLFISQIPCFYSWN